MNKTSSIAIIFLILVSFLSCTSEKTEIFYADPTIFYESGKYYLTGTRNIEPFGFAILESDNLTDWSSPSEDTLHMILRKGDGSFGDRGFWAPQILKIDKQYYYTYTANEQTVLARSENILGPYKQDSIAPIDGSEKNIDSYIFKDDDGKYYLYHVRFNNGNYLWVAEFDINTGKIKNETLTQCFGKTEDWEATSNYKSAPIMEGPTILKLKGTYYMIYSANHFMNIDYAVGYATSTSPFGPWKKYEGNPIIHRSIVGENGSGHGDVLKTPEGNYYYVYHVHNSTDKVVPRRTRIVPLKFEWSKALNIYKISADADNIIIPTTEIAGNKK